MKCTWCKTRLEADHRKGGRWTFGEGKGGEGFYACPHCSKTLVPRYKVNVTAPLSLFLAGVFSPAAFFGLLYLGERIVGLSEGWSLSVTALLQIFTIAVLWIRTFESVEVATYED